MNRKDIVNKLLSEGISDKTLAKLNDKQLSTLLSRFTVNEQTSSSTDDSTKGIPHVKSGSKDESNLKNKGKSFITYESEMKENENSLPGLTAKKDVNPGEEVRSKTTDSPGQAKITTLKSDSKNSSAPNLKTVDLSSKKTVTKVKNSVNKTETTENEGETTENEKPISKKERFKEFLRKKQENKGKNTDTSVKKQETETKKPVEKPKFVKKDDVKSEKPVDKSNLVKKEDNNLEKTKKIPNLIKKSDLISKKSEKEVKEIKEWVDQLVQTEKKSITTKNEIVELIKNRIQEQFHQPDIAEPTTKPGTKEPRTPSKPNKKPYHDPWKEPGVGPDPKPKMETGKESELPDFLKFDAIINSVDENDLETTDNSLDSIAESILKEIKKLK